MLYTRLLRWVSLSTAVLACLWFSPSLLDPFNIPKLAILMVGAALLLGLLLGNPKEWFNRTEWPMWGSIGVFILGLSAAALASDQNSYRTLWGAWARNDGWLAYVALAIITLSVAVAFRGRDAQYGLWAIIGVGYVQVGYALLQTTGNDPIHWSNGYNPILGTVGNPNFASALLGITAVAMCWSAFENSTWIAARVANATVALVAVWLTLRSDSIQGTLAFGAGFAVVLAAWLSESNRPLMLRRMVAPYLTLGALGLGLGVWGLTGGGPLGSVLFSQNLVNRTYYWRAGWNMFKRDPIFGVGLDSFGDWYRLVRLPEQVAATGAQTVSNAAHSVVFQMLGTGGIAMFGTYLLTQVVALWRGVIALRSGENRLLVGAVFGGWAAFLLQSLFSIDQLGLTVWGWVLTGLLIGVSYPSDVELAVGKTRHRRRASTAHGSQMAAPIIAASIAGLAAIVCVSIPLSFEAKIRTAVSYGYDIQKPNALLRDQITQAVVAALDGADDPYWRATGVNKLFTVGAVEQGLKLAEASALQFPNDVTLWHLAATAYEQTGRPSMALPWRSRAVELDPLNTEYATLLAADRKAAGA